MRGVIVVESEADYNKWIASQKSEYLTLFPEKDPSKKAEAASSDSTSAPKEVAQLINKP
jgi:cytochrome c oxidase subunit 2